MYSLEEAYEPVIKMWIVKKIIVSKLCPAFGPGDPVHVAQKTVW